MLESSLDESHLGNGGRKGLSDRELDVLGLTAHGLSNKEVASQLQVSVHAVKFHLASIYRKLGVANRTEAAVFFLTSSAGDGSPTQDAEVEA